MFKTILPYLIPTATAFISWVFAFFYYRKERKNDLSAKLFEQLDELSNKYIELNDKYVKLHLQMCKLQKENNELKAAIKVIKPEIKELKENSNG
jgi:peptidoglycan hydrolase CwlO-like protein